MVTCTIREYLQGKLDWLENGYHIYIFRNKEHVFYVGRSNDVIRRIEEHISPKHRITASYMGDIVWENRPESFDWQLEFYTLEECLPVVQERYPNYDRTPGMETAELSMIMHHHPCFNSSNNVKPGPCPDYVRFPELEAGLTDNLY